MPAGANRKLSHSRGEKHPDVVPDCSLHMSFSHQRHTLDNYGVPHEMKPSVTMLRSASARSFLFPPTFQLSPDSTQSASVQRQGLGPMSQCDVLATLWGPFQTLTKPFTRASELFCSFWNAGLRHYRANPPVAPSMKTHQHFSPSASLPLSYWYGTEPCFMNHGKLPFAEMVIILIFCHYLPKHQECAG